MPKKRRSLTVAVKDLPFPFWEPWGEFVPSKDSGFSKVTLTAKALDMIESVDLRRREAVLGGLHTALDEMNELERSRTVGVPKFKTD